MSVREIQLDLSGKTALVTGSSRGIGKAIAKAMADAGAKVVVTGRDIETVKQAAEEIGPLAFPVQADVTSETEIERMFKEAKELTGGSVDILVNNAGTQIAILSVEEMTLDVWNKAVDLNLTGTMLCCKHAITAMKKKGWGRVINVSSISANSGGGPGGTSYASAKGGVSNFTKGMAKEAGPFGITVNAISPGVIMTKIHEVFSTKENLENLKNMTPLGRLGEPEDVAGIALFLASDSSSFITGEAIAVNGGLRMD